MEQRIFPSEKQSHVPGIDKLSKHCQEPPAPLQAWPRGQRAAAHQLSSLSFFPETKFQSAPANKSTSSLLAAPVLLPFNS